MSLYCTKYNSVCKFNGTAKGACENNKDERIIPCSGNIMERKEKKSTLHRHVACKFQCTLRSSYIFVRNTVRVL